MSRVSANVNGLVRAEAALRNKASDLTANAWLNHAKFRLGKCDFSYKVDTDPKFDEGPVR